MNLRLVFISVLTVRYAQAFTALQSKKKTTSDTSTTKLNENILEGRKIAGGIQPVNDFILVKTVAEKESTDGGILLTGSSKIEKTRGTVVSVGPGTNHEETGRVMEIPLEPGNGVVYGEYDGIEIDFNGAPHMLIRNNNILVKYLGDKMTLDSVNVIGNRVLVKINDDDEESVGGVILATPSSKETRPSTGTVVKIGEGKMTGDGTILPMLVSIGDKVKFMDYAGNEIEIEEEEFSVVLMSEILAKF
mmetsp:Transcript_37464/g.42813  ORF Transcript_37464/g.42813 Transcript_37464/m.42813 type:complete len:247 (+) Transcript_37464:144-884(+)